MKKNIVVYLLFPICQILIFAGVFISVGSIDFNGILGVAASLVADVFILLLLQKLGKMNEVKAARREAEIMLQAEELRNKETEDHQQEMMNLRKELEAAFEDTKKKILANQDAALTESAIQSFQEKLDGTRTAEYSTSPVINAIVSSKKRYIEGELALRLKTDINVMEEIKIEDLDLCSIFSNLLDNAAEAVASLREKGEENGNVASGDGKGDGKGISEEILLSAEIKKGFLVVKTVNSADKEHVGRKKREGHGFGRRILADIAKKYQGEFRTEFKNQKFTATVIVKAV